MNYTTLLLKQSSIYLKKKTLTFVFVAIFVVVMTPLFKKNSTQLQQ